MATKKEIELQQKCDVEKWVASETAGRDLCGEAFEFCAYCDKSLEFPCAKASAVMKKKTATPKAKKTTSTKTTKTTKTTATKKTAGTKKTTATKTAKTKTTKASDEKDA